ncbi:hypothetical protein BGZ54_003640 [Gamsiella multidivaricata]|nr:hypothetical protein BGZ54_003640 [Gamsiella multidivaricata]
MEDFMDAHINKSSMRLGQPVPPFFFPKARTSGPDIVFFIRAKQNMFPVFMQLKLRQVVSKTGADSVLDSSSGGEVLGHMMDLGKYYPTDKTYISMIIGYPAKAVASLRPRPNFCPKLNGLKQVVIKVDETNFSSIFPKSHIDFLDGIKSPLKRAPDDEQGD